jgi:hypothetical protein
MEGVIGVDELRGWLEGGLVGWDFFGEGDAWARMRLGAADSRAVGWPGGGCVSLLAMGGLRGAAFGGRCLRNFRLHAGPQPSFTAPLVRPHVGTLVNSGRACRRGVGQEGVGWFLRRWEMWEMRERFCD